MNKYLNPKSYINFLKCKLMPFHKSYAQVGEDLIINFYLKEKKRGFYVDVGASHPKRFSNTYLFYKKGWTGINIEPDPINFKLLLRSRPRDINLNLGVGRKKKNLDFYIFKSHTLSTFSKEVADDYQRMGYVLDRIEKIPVAPLVEVLDKYIQKKIRIDFMSIDTEGYDMEVLESNNWDKYRPKFLILETTEFKNGGSGKKLNKINENYYDDFLRKHSYEKFADTYINTIYIEKKFATFSKVLLK